MRRNGGNLQSLYCRVSDFPSSLLDLVSVEPNPNDQTLLTLAVQAYIVQGHRYDIHEEKDAQ